MNKLITKAVVVFSIIMSHYICAAEYDYLQEAHSYNLNKCDDLLDKNFSFFNSFKSGTYQVYNLGINSKTKGMSTVRYYFSYENDKSLTFGDIVFVQTPTECQSHMQINLTSDNTSCALWEDHESNEWDLDESHNETRWLINKTDDMSSMTPINDNKGCIFRYFKSNIQDLQ
jgi:hypothetical protein